jgi:hypothetical protein
MGGDEILAATPAFSPDSRHIAVGVRHGTKWLVVVDGLGGNEYEGIIVPIPLFSPDSKVVAYAAQRAGKWVIVAGGVEGKEYDGLLKNGRLVFDSTTDLHTLAGRAGEFLRVNLSMVIPATKPSGTPQSKR